MPIDVSVPPTPAAASARPAARAPLVLHVGALRVGALPVASMLAGLLALGCGTPDGKPPADDDGATDGVDPGDGPDGVDTGDTSAGDPGDTAPGGADDTATGDTSEPDDAPGDTAPDRSEDTGPGDTPGDTDAAAGWPCERWAEPVEAGRVEDSALGEISGIAPSRANPGVLWVHEDSGGEPVVYALDASGASLGSVTLSGVTNRDWEGLAVAACPDGEGDCLWVGDTGDNGLSRSDVAVHVVREPVVTAGLDAAAEPTTYRYSFPDGRGNVEGFAVGPDGLPVLVTKRVDGTADVYRFPTLDADRSVTLEHVTRISTGDPNDEHPAEATAADISPDGSRLLVRTYGFLHEYTLTDGVPGDRVSLPAPDEPQGEAVAYDAARRGIWVTSEGSRQPLWFLACRDE